MKVRLLTATALACMTTNAVHAQDSAPDTTRKDEIPVVIVTADKSAKSVQKTSMAVSVVSGQEITQEGRTKIDDVLVNQPATIVQGAAKGFLVSIRGLGLSLPPQLGQGAVSTNYDGAYSGRAENASAGFYDLDRVEVLRGPQATLYGRSAIGGVVNVISKDPSLAGDSGYVAAELGSYNLGHLEGAFNTPLGDHVALRVAGAVVSRDGYLSNGHDDNVAQALRAKLLIKPSEDSKLILGAEATHIGGKGTGGAYVAPGVQEPDTDRYTDDVAAGHQNVNYRKVWAAYTAKLGPGTLFIEPALQQTHGVSKGAFGGNIAWSADPLVNKQKSLEVRYASEAGANWQWNVGYYHYDSHNQQKALAGACEDVDGNYMYVPGYGYSGAGPGVQPSGGCAYPSASWTPRDILIDYRNSFTDGLFGQVTVPLGTSFRVIAGLRAAEEKITGRNIADSNVDAVLPTSKDDHFDYRIGFESDVGATSMVYGTVNSGYRQGGYNFDGTLYEPEKMTAYELGSKNRFLDGRLQVNGDMFYYDYQAYQLVLFTMTQTGPSIQVLTTPAQEMGFEVEAQAKLSDKDTLYGSLVLLDSKLKGDTVFKDAPFPNAPKTTLKFGYSHVFTLGSGASLTPRIDLRGVDKQYVYPDQNPVTDIRDVQKAYSTGDISLLYRAPSGAWSLNAYVKNVNDAIIKQSFFFGYAQLSAPRTYGLVLNRTF
ncbi:MAG: TonB-dependent receptor [Asticcacaulis sp.]|uniref:TonB-dependent receptor n=1 Tax=Asticcacaulis sp. TaxID=1872648 RepID=UPI0039E61EDF